MQLLACTKGTKQITENFAIFTLATCTMSTYAEFEKTATPYRSNAYQLPGLPYEADAYYRIDLHGHGVVTPSGSPPLARTPY